MYNYSPGQQAAEEYTLAQLEADRAFQEDRFETGTQALEDKGIVRKYFNDFRSRAADSIAALNKKKKIQD